MYARKQEADDFRDGSFHAVVAALHDMQRDMVEMDARAAGHLSMLP